MVVAASPPRVVVVAAPIVVVVVAGAAVVVVTGVVALVRSALVRLARGSAAALARRSEPDAGCRGTAAPCPTSMPTTRRVLAASAVNRRYRIRVSSPGAAADLSTSSVPEADHPLHRTARELLGAGQRESFEPVLGVLVRNGTEA